MPLIPWEPFRLLRRREEMFEDLFRDFFRDVSRRLEVEGDLFEPAAEVAETDEDVTVKLEVPGVEKDQLGISVAHGVLSVRGETRSETEKKQKDFHRQEIRYGGFARAIGLPAEVDADKATAELKNGVLKITLPKSKQARSREIKVAVT